MLGILTNSYLITCTELVADRLQRGRDGRFLDSDLAKILYDATECSAGSTDRGMPSCQRITQIQTIERARSEGMCSLNDYRRFLGLKRMYFILMSVWVAD